MADEIFENENEMEVDVFTLTDEEGNESDFELIGAVEVEGTTYYALIPCEDDGKEETEYIVLRGEKDEETGEDVLVSIEDDEEFDRIADIFDDEFADIDYDDAGDDGENA